VTIDGDVVVDVHGARRPLGALEATRQRLLLLVEPLEELSTMMCRPAIGSSSLSPRSPAFELDRHLRATGLAELDLAMASRSPFGATPASELRWIGELKARLDHHRLVRPGRSRGEVVSSSRRLSTPSGRA
jgi:hypothetical protein